MTPDPEPAAMQALVLHPHLDRLGGIEGYYRKVLPHLRIAVESFEIGRRHDEPARWSGRLRPIADYLRLRRRLQRSDVPVVIFNPSLKLDMVLREGFMQRLAKARGRRTIVFWRGWEPGLARRIDRRGRWWFRWLYGSCDAFVVLADEFRATLLRWGMRQPIHGEVTVVDDAALAGVDCDELIARRLASAPRKILFLARLLRPKGIHETLEAFARMGRRDHVRLVVAGDGPESEPARRFAAERGLANVDFLGDVRGDAKWELLRTASVLCLPTQHGEGLPNSVVEAMAFGLPVVTTPVGGVADFFQDGVHGFAVAGADPAGIAAALARLLDDDALYRRIARENHRFARERFLASQAAGRIEAIYRSVQKQTV
jgi:glycosyltransferase involved in cell wall biosynthesis